MVDSTKKYSCLIIEAENGDDFQEYVYEDGTRVPFGTPVGVEISQDDTTEFFLYDDIYFSTELTEL